MSFTITGDHIVLLLLAAGAAWALWMLLRPAARPPEASGALYFTSGGEGGKNDLKIRRRVLLENLRDLQIEKDHGKLSDREFLDLARPLAAELESVEAELDGAGASQSGTATNNGDAAAEDRARSRAEAARAGGVTRNRLGWYCPSCGSLNRYEHSLPQANLIAAQEASRASLAGASCIQCGFRMREGARPEASGSGSNAANAARKS